MPYPSEHSCRLSPPGNYEKFRRGKRKHEGKEYAVIYGKLKDEEKWEDQAYRYDKEVWEAAEAKSHCKEHDGTFEAATEKQDKTGRVLSAANIDKVQAALNALQSLLDAAVEEEEPDKSTHLSEATREAEELEGVVKALKAENEGFDTKQAEERIKAILVQIKK